MSIMITPAELRDLMASATPPVVLDVRWLLSAAPGSGQQAGAQREAYEAGHVPGAAFVDLEEDLAGPVEPTSGRHPLPDPDTFAAAMRRSGVRADRPVVAYDQGNAMSAARAWWLLSDGGHPDAHVLEGGWDAWVAEGGEVERGESAVTEGDWEPTPGQRGRVTADEVVGAVSAGHRVIDVRAAERYRGDTEPLDPVAGHIPGAENLPAGELLGEGGRRLPAERVRERVGRISDGDVLSCGSGITASQVLMLLEDAGLVGAVIYPGSYSEWSRSGRPVETGEQPAG